MTTRPFELGELVWLDCDSLYWLSRYEGGGEKIAIVSCAPFYIDQHRVPVSRIKSLAEVGS